MKPLIEVDLREQVEPRRRVAAPVQHAHFLQPHVQLLGQLRQLLVIGQAQACRFELFQHLGGWRAVEGAVDAMALYRADEVAGAADARALLLQRRRRHALCLKRGQGPIGVLFQTICSPRLS